METLKEKAEPEAAISSSSKAFDNYPTGGQISGQIGGQISGQISGQIGGQIGGQK